ncbi:hypothetical protein D9M69_680700 [compost metagenome]
MVPTITPIAAIIVNSDRMRGMRNTDASRPCRRASTAGSVARCRTKAVTPAASSSAAVSGPASGKNRTLRPTESGGPTIKLSSSATDSSA